MSKVAPTTAALIIPALNEEAILGLTLQTIPKGLYQMIVVADNGSTDRTVEVATDHGATVVSIPEKGYGAACLAAIRRIPPEIDAIVFMQADMSEAPDEAEHLLSPIADGRADMVLGSRTMGMAEPGSLLPHQVFGNWLATSMIRVLYGYEYTDLGPFRAIRRDALDRLEMKDRNYGWTIEMQVRALEEGLRILEVPVSYRVRVAGENKVSGNLMVSLRAGWKIISTILRLWARRRAVSTSEIQRSSSRL